MNLFNAVIGQFASGEILRSFFGLRHQHPEPIFMGDSKRLGIQQQLGFGRVVDNIQYTHQTWEAAQINGGNAGVGIHPHRRCVDDYGSVGVEMEIVVVILT